MNDHKFATPVQVAGRLVDDKLVVDNVFIGGRSYSPASVEALAVLGLLSSKQVVKPQAGKVIAKPTTQAAKAGKKPAAKSVEPK